MSGLLSRLHRNYHQKAQEGSSRLPQPTSLHLHTRAQYPSATGDVDVVMHFPKDGLRQGLTQKVLEASQAAIAEKGSFTLVLAGGSLPALLSGLADPKQVIGQGVCSLVWKHAVLAAMPLVLDLKGVTLPESSADAQLWCACTWCVHMRMY